MPDTPNWNDIDRFIANVGEETDFLRQNRLLDEEAFNNFAKDRGVGEVGVGSGDPGEFFRRGWLRADYVDENGKPYFHPFRIYPLQRLQADLRRVAVGMHVSPESMDNDSNFELNELTRSISERSAEWNHHIDLLVLLEPAYWQGIIDRHSYLSRVSWEEYLDKQKVYRAHVVELIRCMNPAYWEQVHESLRWAAEQLDPNGGLYLLLRLGSWDSRRRLKGHISGSVWLRQIAEVLRRAFEEEGEDIKWPEEDEGFGQWFSDERRRLYGNDRPLDHPLESKPYVALEFGVFTGSVVRWYVEGDTEYFAVSAILPKAEKGGIELVNLRGSIEGERSNAPLRLADGLKQDCAQRRFSIISFDTDVKENVKVIRQQIDQDNVVGFIAANEPDFEFGNFSLSELVEIAARLDEESGCSGDVLRNEDWSGITSGREFERRYTELSARKPRSLKGKEWGIALSRYAEQNPNRSDTDEYRLLLLSIDAALQSRVANYDAQVKHFRFDPTTFKLTRVLNPQSEVG